MSGPSGSRDTLGNCPRSGDFWVFIPRTVGPLDTRYGRWNVFADKGVTSYLWVQPSQLHWRLPVHLPSPGLGSPSAQSIAPAYSEGRAEATSSAGSVTLQPTQLTVSLMVGEALPATRRSGSFLHGSWASSHHDSVGEFVPCSPDICPGTQEDTIVDTVNDTHVPQITCYFHNHFIPISCS